MTMAVAKSPIDTFRTAMARAGKQIRESDQRSQCPGHDGDGFNLAFRESSDGNCLVHCHSHECTFEQICKGLGLQPRELFSNGMPGRKDRTKVVVDGKSLTLHRTSDLAIAALAWSLQKNGQIKKDEEPEYVWDYHNAAGDVVGKVVRWKTDNGKEIRQIRKHDIGWLTKAMLEPRPLYRLPEVVQQYNIYVCEGEKAADAIVSLGLAATTSSQGSTAPGKTDWSPLRGNHVTILPDRDSPGRKYVRAAIELIRSELPGTHVTVLHLWDDLDTLDEGGDAHDWCEHYGSSDADVLVTKLRGLPDHSHEYQTSTESVLFGGKSVADIWDSGDEPVPWAVEGVLSLDQPTVFGARKKSLKTTFLTDLAVALASGTPFLGHFKVPAKRKVLFITGEANDRSAMKKIRRAAEFRNLRAEDLREYLRVETMQFPKLSKAEQIESLKSSIEEHGIEICIIDPLYRGMDGTVNAANMFDVGDILGTFMQTMRPCGVILAHHIKKSAQFRNDIPDLDDLAQAGIAEFAGNFWLMARQAEYQGDGRHDMAVTYGGRDEQFGLERIEFDERSWTARVTELAAHREEVRRRKENAKVASLFEKITTELKRYPDGTSESGLATAIGTKAGRSAFQDAVAELEKRNTIVCIPDFKGGNRRSCKGWRLAK